MFTALMRGSAVRFGVLALIGLVLAGLALASGDVWWALVLVAMLGTLPLALWQSAQSYARNLPPGSWLAYAVTPDGTFHSSNASGTITMAPGHVARVQAAGDCWIVTLSSGVTVPVPRELLPEADVALLTRHLPAARRTA